MTGQPPARLSNQSELAELRIEPTEAGCRIRLRVRPSARRGAVEGEHGGALKVSVAAAPEKGKANRAVEKLLAAALGLPHQSVVVVAGESSRDKVIAVAGLDPAEARLRLRNPRE